MATELEEVIQKRIEAARLAKASKLADLMRKHWGASAGSLARLMDETQWRTVADLCGYSAVSMVTREVVLGLLSVVPVRRVRANHKHGAWR